MVDRTDRLRVVVACDHAEYCHAIACLLDSKDPVEVVDKREEGEDGVEHVRRMAPDVLILGVDPMEDCVRHARLYREGFPGPSVGFALRGDQHGAYQQAGVACTIDGRASARELLRAVVELAGAARNRTA